MMSNANFPWLKALGHTIDDFKAMPEGEDILLWGLKNKIVNETNYLEWASSFYSVPLIKPEFFSMAVDFTLLAKYPELYQWSAQCYPVYEWEDTLFIACISPPNQSISKKTCLVMAPLEPLEKAWLKNLDAKGSAVVPSYAPGNTVITTQMSEASMVQTEEPVETPKEQSPRESVTTVDFSSLVDDAEASPEPTVNLGQESPFEKHQDMTPEASAVEGFIKEPLNEIDFSAPTLEGDQQPIVSDDKTAVTATSAASVPIEKEADSPDKPEVIALGPSEEKQGTPSAPDSIQEPAVEPATSASASSTDDVLPPLDDLKALQVEDPQSAPGLEPPVAEQEEVSTVAESFADDYTPVPIVTKEQQEAQERRRQEALQKKISAKQTESTITDHAQPIHTPPENQITAEDFKAAETIENADTMKLVIAHLFSHLKRDYKQLMWVEKNNESLFFPKYVYGPWNMTSLAWRMHVNINNPNIFRIAFKSESPFHGVVYINPYNEKYFEWWNEGVCPDYATVYPIIIDEKIIGFITGFNKNEQFDEVASLKKIENLVALCKKNMESLQGSKAA